MSINFQLFSHAQVLQSKQQHYRSADPCSLWYRAGKKPRFFGIFIIRF